MTPEKSYIRVFGGQQLITGGRELLPQYALSGTHVVSVIEADGELVTFAAEGSGAFAEVTPAGGLVIHRDSPNGDVIFTYSPSGWQSMSEDQFR